MSEYTEYCIAGTFQQYREWLRETGKTTSAVKYVAHERVLRGVHGAIIHRVGTWLERSDALDVSRAANIAEVR